MPEYITKRDGRRVVYDEGKIAAAIGRAFDAVESGKGNEEAKRLAGIVTREINARESAEIPSVEDIQDQVEQRSSPKDMPKPRRRIFSIARSAAAPARPRPA